MFFYKKASKFIDKIVFENQELREENNNFKNDYLVTQNHILREKVGKLEDLLSESMQENHFLNDKIKDLEIDNRSLEGRIEGIEGEFGIIKIDEDFYNTKELDNKQCFDTIDKLTDERDIYKEVINVMCDKYNIEHDEVFDIIDDIQSSKDNQLEKEFI